MAALGELKVAIRRSGGRLPLGQDVYRLEATEVRRSFTYHTVIGSTKGARLLVVVWIDHPEGRFPVHARQAGRAAARRYYR